MSTPQWKLDQQRREAEARAKKASDDAAKAAELAAIKARYDDADRARRAADDDDERRVQQRVAELGEVYTRTTDEARTAAQREAFEREMAAGTLCLRCHASLKDSGAFVRLPKLGPVHRACLQCDKCSASLSANATHNIVLVEHRLLCSTCGGGGVAARAEGCPKCGCPPKTKEQDMCFKCGADLK